MGNTPTKDKKEDIYASYIQRQQDLIYKQQNQINELYKFNLQSQQQMPPNRMVRHKLNNCHMPNNCHMANNCLNCPLPRNKN